MIKLCTPYIGAAAASALQVAAGAKARSRANRGAVP